MNYVRPKKNLGQHFLKDLGIAQQIVEGLKAETYQQVIEIGPGMGVLTDILLQRNDIELFAAEVDGESVEYLKVRHPEFAKEHLLFGDFLKCIRDRVWGDWKFSVQHFVANIF